MRRLDTCLAEEALDDLGVVASQELERDEAAEAGVARLEDVAHAAAADEVDDLVAVPSGDWEDLERVGWGQLGFVARARGGRAAGQPVFVLETELASEAGEGVVLQ